MSSVKDGIFFYLMSNRWQQFCWSFFITSPNL